MFAIEHFGVEPDLITIAKSMAAGVPISGVFGRAAPDGRGAGQLDRRHVRGLAARLRRPASPCSTRSTDATCCAAAPRSASGSAARFDEWAGRFDQIGDVRGLGPMLALEFVTDRSSKTPAPDIATAVHEHAVQSGLLLLKAGIHGNCVRVLVSLVATDEQIGEALDIFEAAIEQAVGAPRLATTAG